MQKRLISLDIMRLVAIFLMIEGHSVNVFFNTNGNIINSNIFYFWNMIRGFTAPIFIFLSGTLLSYLLLASKAKVPNIRVKKGVKRGSVLIFIGYLLRYPTHKVIDFSDVTTEQWNIFFSVDILHLIGIGIIIISLLFDYYKEFLKITKSILPLLILIILAFLFFLLSPYINGLTNRSNLPNFIVGYFSFKNGSLFPLFPYLGYIFIGSAFGVFLYNKKKSGIKRKERFLLFLFALVLIILWKIFHSYEYSLSFFRTGIVILLFLLSNYIGKKIAIFPNKLILISKNSLFIYIAHLIILYGCAWFPGLYKYIGKSFNLIETIFLTIFIYLLLILLIFIKENIVLKYFRKSE